MPRKPSPTVERACAWILCSKPFTTRDPRKRYCTRSHAKAAWDRKNSGNHLYQQPPQRPTHQRRDEILALYDSGLGQSAIAHELQLSKGVIAGIVHRWRQGYSKEDPNWNLPPSTLTQRLDALEANLDAALASPIKYVKLGPLEERKLRESLEPILSTGTRGQINYARSRFL